MVDARYSNSTLIQTGENVFGRSNDRDYYLNSLIWSKDLEILSKDWKNLFRAQAPGLSQSPLIALHRVTTIA